MFEKIISGNDIRHGSSVFSTDQLGNSEVVPVSVSLDGVHHSSILENRMKLHRFYSGDENGLTPPETTTTYTVAANGDDGVGSTGYVSYTNNTLSPSSLNTSRTYIQIGALYEGEEVEWDHSIGFFRFDNITAAQGATIQSAYLKPYKMSFVGSAVNPDINFKIRALDQDDPAAPSSASDLRGNVPGLYTAAEGLWDRDTLRAESNSSEVTSPDLKDVIQEIVNRSGWSSGNAIVIVMYLNNAAYSGAYSGGLTNYVSFESYDNTNSNPAKLEITI